MLRADEEMLAVVKHLAFLAEKIHDQIGSLESRLTKVEARLTQVEGRLANVEAETNKSSYFQEPREIPPSQPNPYRVNG